MNIKQINLPSTQGAENKGGKNKPENIQALCPNCHSKKTHKEDLKKAVKKVKNPNSKRQKSSLGDHQLRKTLKKYWEFKIRG